MMIDEECFVLVKRRLFERFGSTYQFGERRERKKNGKRSR